MWFHIDHWTVHFIFIFFPIPFIISVLLSSLFTSRNPHPGSPSSLRFLSWHLNPFRTAVSIGDKLLRIWVVCPENGTAVLKGLNARMLHPFLPSYPHRIAPLRLTTLLLIGALSGWFRLKNILSNNLSFLTHVGFELQHQLLTLLEPQSRLGDKALKFQVVCPQNGTALQYW